MSRRRGYTPSENGQPKPPPPAEPGARWRHDGKIIDYSKMQDLIEASSLGTPEAARLRATVPDEQARLIVRLSAEQGRADRAEAKVEELRAQWKAIRDECERWRQVWSEEHVRHTTLRDRVEQIRATMRLIGDEYDGPDVGLVVHFSGLLHEALEEDWK